MKDFPEFPGLHQAGDGSFNVAPEEMPGLIGPQWAVGWDLDSTVFDTRHRQHMLPLIKQKKATYKDYSLMCVDDTVLPGRIEMMRAFHDAGMPNFGISGRNDIAIKQTWDVIHKFGVPLDSIYLRPDDDYSKNWTHKVKGIRFYENLGYRFRFYFEDWREAGEKIVEETSIPVIILDACYPAESQALSAGHQSV